MALRGLATLSLLLGLCCGGAQAAEISEIGSVRFLTSPQDRYYMYLGQSRFTTSGGTVSLDVLGRGFADGPNQRGVADPYMFLFADDGDLGLEDLIAQNDDSRSTFGDGSSSQLDSFLSLDLDAGNYAVFVGRYARGSEIDLEAPRDRDYFVPQGYLQFRGTDPTYHADSYPYRRTEDYRLTITGDGVAFRPETSLANVPLPTPVALLGGALALLFGAYRPSTRKS